MSKSTISTFKLFELIPDNETARLYLEARLWPNGTQCPDCKSADRISERPKRLGFYHCNACNFDFTIRTGTIFERSKVPLHKWVYAMYLLVTSRKGISSMQLAKEIGVTQKTAWFILGRLREACSAPDSIDKLKGIIEIDEAFFGGKEGNKHESKKRSAHCEGASVSAPLVVSFGGGINSAALLIGMKEHAIIPDLILFADTGGEKPETYKFVDLMRTWCVRNLDLGIVAVSHPKGDTLRDSCFRNGTLPSKAYGFPGCSVKFKHQFMESYENKVYGKTRIIVKAIGYHAGETRRSDITEKGRYQYRYFLREWGWDQQACLEAINRAGLPIPMKSACYYCPSSKAHEIVWLAKEHPDLFADAVAMEHNAQAYHAERGGLIKGLGRRWSWEELIANAKQAEEYQEPDSVPCMCYDGGEDE